MSNVSTTHDVKPYVSGVSEPLADQRLVKIVCKQSAAMKKAGKAALPSACVSIPMLEQITENEMDKLMPHVTELLESAQDGICRAAYTSGARVVHSDQLTVPKCIEFLNMQAESNRITKESVGKWVETSGLADALRLRFVQVLGLSEADCELEENVARVETQVAGYAEKFAALAGSKTYYEPKIAKNLLQALTLKPEDEDDMLGAKFAERLGEMVANPKRTPDLLSLGLD